MSMTFNVDEIFEMAEEIERNGAKFYRLASARATDNEMRKILLDLAVMEDGHLKTFVEMRKTLSQADKEPLVFDPDNQAAAYLQVYARSRGFEGKKSTVEMLTGKESIEEVLKIALNAEKESVLFYVGLKEMIEDAQRAKVEAIAREEMGHVSQLTGMLGAARAGKWK